MYSCHLFALRSPATTNSSVPHPGDPASSGAAAMTVALLFHASACPSTVRGAAGKVKHLTEMLVEVLQGAALSLACTAYLQPSRPSGCSTGEHLDDR